MKDHRIFISYRRDGGDISAKLISEALKNRGYSTFYDYDALKGGVFDDQIRQEIVNCTDVVLVLPKNALDRCVNENDWVRQEIALALKHNKNIIPVMLQGFDFPDSLPEEIDKVRYYNGVRFYMEFFDAVIDGIVAKLIPVSKPEPADEEEEGKTSEPADEEKDEKTPEPTDEEKDEKTPEPADEEEEGKTSEPSDEEKDKKTTEKKAARRSAGLKWGLISGAILLWIIAVGLFSVAILFIVEGYDADIIVETSGLGLFSIYVGLICFLIGSKGANKKNYLICSAVAFALALLLLGIGAFLVVPFLLICHIPFIGVFVLLGILFIVLLFHKRGSRVNRPLIVAYSVLSVLLAALAFVAVLPYYFELGDAILALQGDAEAQKDVGDFYYKEQIDPEAALEWYQRSLEGGCIDAAYGLGDLYYYGLAVEKDYQKAAELYLYSSQYPYLIEDEIRRVYSKMIPQLMTVEINVDALLEGSFELDGITPEDAYYLGTMYWTGVKSYDEDFDVLIALFFLEVASDSGHASAPYFMGRILADSDEYGNNDNLALDYYYLAQSRGYPYSIEPAIEELLD